MRVKIDVRVRVTVSCLAFTPKTLNTVHMTAVSDVISNELSHIKLHVNPFLNQYNLSVTMSLNSMKNLKDICITNANTIIIKSFQLVYGSCFYR